MAMTRIVQLTDLHLLATPGELLYGVDSGAALQDAVGDIQKLDPPPNAILLTGDIAQDGRPHSYARVKQLLAPLELSVYVLPGNHDDSDAMRSVLVGDGFVMQTLAMFDEWRCVLLDSTVPGRDHGYINAGTLLELRNILTQHIKHPVLIALHHSPTVECSAYDCQLENREEFLSLLQQFSCVKGVIAGHVHCQAEEKINGIRLMATPSTFLHVRHHSRDPDTDHSNVRLTHTIDGTRRAYRILDLLDNGEINTDVRWY